MSLRMIKMVAVLAIFGMLQTTNAGLGFGQKGHCPKLKGTMHDRGQKLEPHRLAGQWKVVYDHKDRTKDLDCQTVKYLSGVEGLNQTQLKLLVGYKEDSIDQIFFDEDTLEKTDQILYDDDSFLTFNHQEFTNMAAVQTLEEFNDPTQLKALETLKEETPETTDGYRDRMSEEELKQYEIKLNDILEYQELVKKRLQQSKLYDNYQLVLDTDYDNYLMMYSCQEQTQKVNQNGQSESDIAQLKLSDNTKILFDEEFIHDQTEHQMHTTIQTRTLDKSYLTQKKIDSLVGHLKSMIDVDDKKKKFAVFQVIEHGPNCPHESMDFFEEAGEDYANVQFEEVVFDSNLAEEENWVEIDGPEQHEDL